MLVRELGLKYKRNIDVKSDQIKQSSDIVNIFRPVYDKNGEIEISEYSYAAYTDNGNKILSVMLIGIGGSSGTVVDIKKVITPALIQNASNIFICHNHPSGQLYPSDADIKLTRKLKNACKLLDIRLLDHIIITKESYYSLADNGFV